ncbi:MAG: glucose 1-dehydrogenase [Chloroflexi bacterium]|nr:glucose 1-dehydrogenase [Chloroflexota bacterium]
MAIPSFSLEGKVALIAGGSRGIGRAIALGFAEAGADVAVCARNLPDLEQVAQEVRQRGRRALPIQADVTVKAEVEAMVARMMAELGGLDILVNNAATSYMRPMVELREDGWDRVMNLGLKSYFLCSQAAARVMLEKKKGNIINMSSASAVKADSLLSAYCTAKAGVAMLTRVLAIELGPYVRVNAIGPGVVRTKFSEAIWSNPELLRQRESRLPLRRIAEPEDIVGPAIFLASDASAYITGQSLYVDGGALA